MSSSPDSEVTVRVTITLDRNALAELSAALVPVVAEHVRAEMLKAFRQMGESRPSVQDVKYPAI
jgi:hypothetical protein